MEPPSRFGATEDRFDLIVAFDVFEHLRRPTPRPDAFCRDDLALAADTGTIPQWL
jgi:hypothetical protein